MTETPPQRDDTQRYARALDNLVRVFCIIVVAILYSATQKPQKDVVSLSKDNKKILLEIQGRMLPLFRRKSATNEKITKKLDLIANSMNLNDTPDTE
ncbi:MAG: hypothetical protein ABGW78_04665 [Pirellulales bacterium]